MKAWRFVVIALLAVGICSALLRIGAAQTDATQTDLNAPYVPPGDPLPEPPSWLHAYEAESVRPWR